MKSSIKIDVTLTGKPVIQVCAHPTWDDLRDKALNMFLNTLSLNGRLCFIDSSGSKLSGSFGGDGVRNYSIVPIAPEHYELLLEEVKILIQERNERFDNNTEQKEGSTYSYGKNNAKILKEMNEFQVREAMNY